MNPVTARPAPESGEDPRAATFAGAQPVLTARATGGRVRLRPLADGTAARAGG